MAFEINDLKGIFILVLFAIPMIATTNINCNGRAFHCVNSTHFMICVDLGGGLSTTIDDFVIPCPATTVCHENNSFECDFPEVATMPPLEVVGVYKQSDTSETTTVTNSVTPTSEIFSVFNENLTATTLPIPEDVTPVVKLEVLEKIKDPVRINSDNSTEKSVKVTSSIFDTDNEIFNEKETRNLTVITSATDNNKTFAPAVETSIYKSVNTSLIDKSISNDTVTSVIGLINLISADAPIVVITKPHSEVLTSLDSSFDTIVTTTEPYKEVTTLGETVDNPTDDINISTEAIIIKSSVIIDEVSTTSEVNRYNESNVHNSTDNINKSDINNQNIAERNTSIRSNITIEVVPETKTVDVTSAQTDNITEPVTVVDSPQTTTVNTFVSSGTIDLITANPNQSVPSTNDYIDTLTIDAAPTNDQYTTNLEAKLSGKPIDVELISTTPAIDTVVENNSKSDINNNSFSELNSTSTVEIVPVLKINYSIPAEEILQTTIEHTFVPITTVASILNNTETETISEVLFNNDSPIENQTIISQPLDVIIATDSPIAVTDNLYQINGELNQTLITTKNTISDTINTTDKEITELNATSKSIITEKNTEHALLLPSKIKDPALEKMKTETLLNVVSQRELEVTIEAPVVNVSNNFNEHKDNVKNNTLFKTSNTSSTAFNSSSTESTFTTSTTTTFFTIELSSAETSQNDFVIKAIEVKKELNERATSGFDKPKLESNGINALLNVRTTPATSKVTSDLVPDTLAMDISSQKDQQTDFTPETTTLQESYVYTEINQGTTQQTNAVSESPNQSENSGIISLLKNRTDDKIFEKVVGITTTPFPRDFTENTSLGDIVESINQDTVAASDVENSEHKVLKPILTQAPVTVDYVTELASTTPNTGQTVPISIDSTTISGLVSSHNPITDDLYRTSTTSYVETSTKFPLDVTHTINEENVPDVLITALPLQQSNNQIINTVKQLNTTNSLTETISNLVFTTVITDVDNITDLNTSSWNNTANIDTVSFRVQHTNANVKTETSDPINGENNDNANSSVVNTNRDNGIKIMSIVNVVNSTENVMLSGTMQPSSLNPSLSTDYIATTASHDSDAYVTATDNVSNYNLVHNESVSQKIPEATVSLIATNISNSAVSTQTTLLVTETNIGNVQYVSTEANFPRNVDFKEDNPASTVGDYVAQKTNNYLPTEEMSSQSNIVPNVQAVTLPESGNVTPDKVLTQGDSTIAPIYNEFWTIKDNAFIMSSTEISLGVLSHSNIIQGTESPPLKLKVNQSSESKTAKYNEDSSSPILEVPVAQFTIEPTHATILTTPSAVIGPKNQEIIPGIKTTVLPQYMMSSLPVEPVTATNINSETSHTTFSQTIPSSTIGQMNQHVFIGIKTTDLPQDVMTTVNNNIPPSVPSLPTIEVTPAEIITEPTPTAIFIQTPIDQDIPPGLKSTELPQYEIPMVKNNNPQTMPAVGLTIAQTTPIASGGKNQDVITETKTTELPQYVISTLGSNNQQSMPTLPTIKILTENVPTEIKTINLPEPVTVVTNNNPEPISSLVTGATASQSTTGPTHTSNEYAKTTPLLAATVKTKQDVPSEILSMPQYVTTTAIYKNPQYISDITTETIIDALSAPDSVVETISVVVDTITDTIPSSVTFTSRPTAIKADNSVKNIIDHESIVIGTTSKTTKLVDYNRAEIVNHTESNWMPSDFNIDNPKIKQSSIEETDSQSSVSKSGTDVQNKATAKIDPKDDTPTDKIENSLTTATSTKNYNGSESVSQNNTSLSKIVDAKDKKTEIYYPENANITIIDVTKYQAPADFQNISNSNNENNTKANITTSHYNLSQKNSTINDELEQHLVSTNHTITAEVQSHLNESDKQSNKTRDEVTVNATMHNPDLTSTKLNASSKDTTVITVPASVFNCTNHTRGKYADTKDCRKFYTCIGTLQAILGTCPNNTVFSEINKQCTRNLSHCVRNNQFRCLFEGRFSDFFKDNIYYICVKNRIQGFIRYKLQCQSDYHLNKDSVKCEKNAEISIQSVSSVSETNNDESKLIPKSEKKVSTDDFECESEGKFPYAEDCIKYYECTKVKNVYRRKIKKCVSDEVFDKNKKKCVESDSGEC